MKLFNKELSIFQILLIVFVIIFFLSIGLCGLDRNSTEEFGGTLSGLGFVGFLVSVPGCIITVISWVIYSAFQTSSSKYDVRLNLTKANAERSTPFGRNKGDVNDREL